MPPFINLTGQIYGRLTVLYRAANQGREVCWRCLCSCGKRVTVRRANLREGVSRSCGCLFHDVILFVNRRHGYAPRTGASSTYTSWQAMYQRCSNPRNRMFRFYGARGVKVCKRWRRFENFLADMGEKPEGTSLSRFGDVGDYKPGNCAWHTWEEQRAEARKKRGLA